MVRFEPGVLSGPWSEGSKRTGEGRRGLAYPINPKRMIPRASLRGLFTAICNNVYRMMLIQRELPQRDLLSPGGVIRACCTRDYSRPRRPHPSRHRRHARASRRSRRRAQMKIGAQKFLGSSGRRRSGRHSGAVLLSRVLLSIRTDCDFLSRALTWRSKRQVRTKGWLPAILHVR